MAIGLGTVLMILFGLVPLGAGVALVVLAFRALLKYIRCKDMDMRQKAAPEKRPLGEVLRARRTACNMTQEFVAGALGVSRQAVSKWEQGRAAPSTANLLALAKLYGACAEELLQEAESAPAAGQAHALCHGRGVKKANAPTGSRRAARGGFLHAWERARGAVRPNFRLRGNGFLRQHAFKAARFARPQARGRVRPSGLQCGRCWCGQWGARCALFLQSSAG